MTKIEAIEAGGKFDPVTQAPSVNGKIKFREPGAGEQKQGFISANKLLEYANQALEEAGLKVWIALDRLDSAFDESDKLENNALRALFRVYLDLSKYRRVSLKIFLRSDIWQRLAGEQRMPESSHITRTTTISWDRQSLLKLIVRRALHNESLLTYYAITDPTYWRDPQKQSELFYRMFPEQMDGAEGPLPTLDWMLYWTSDGSGLTTPRELIHLLSEAREIQLQDLIQGESEPPGEILLDREALMRSLPAVSRIRYNQTFCAEFPKLADWTAWLEGKSPEQTADTLAGLWGSNRNEALALANELFQVGLFKREGTRDNPIFIVPYLYRPALKMIEGLPGRKDLTAAVPKPMLQQLESNEVSERASAVRELSKVEGEDAFYKICSAFDDEAIEVRGAAARALFDWNYNSAESFTRALREGSLERRRNIGESIASSGLADEALSQLVGETRETVYEAFSLLFLMAKAREFQPLIDAITNHPNNEVRLAVVKIIELAREVEILPALRRLAVRGSLPTEVRSAVMDAIYQISSNQSGAS